MVVDDAGTLVEIVWNLIGWTFDLFGGRSRARGDRDRGAEPFHYPEPLYEQRPQDPDR